MIRILTLLLMIAATVAVVAQERITLSAPETAPNIQNYRLGRFIVIEDDPATPADEGVLSFELVGVERASVIACQYNATTTPTGSTLVVGLNKANLASAYAGNASTGSLKQRIFHRLVILNEGPMACGRSLAGTLTGVPQ